MAAQIGIDIAKAAAIIKVGGIVGMPTETVYGLAGDAMNPEAVLAIFKAKKRPFFDPLIVHVADMHRVEQLVTDFPEAARKLALKYWPGPLTLLLPKHPSVPDVVTSGLDRVALRMPAHPMALELIRASGTVLAAPSANPFGYISPTTAAHVADRLGNEVDYVLDGGACNVGLESTIVGFEAGRPVVYRKGGLDLKILEAELGQLIVNEHSESNPQAPGTLKSHYAPRTPFFLGDLEILIKAHAGSRMAIIYYASPQVFYLGAVHTEILAPDGMTDTAARNLFSALRRADASGAEVILCAPVPDAGLGPAINDRLRRAATPEQY